MNITRLQQIAYAEGFIEDFIEEYLAELDEETAGPRTLEQAQQLQTLWTALTSGLKELRKENSDLLLRMAHAGSLLNQ